MTRQPRALASSALVLLVGALVLSGCGGTPAAKKSASPSPSPSSALPTGDVKVPSGTTLTKAGTTLAFGQPATVAFEANAQRGSVLTLQVDSVQTGRIADFAAYQLDAQTQAATPYYVHATVTNAGTGDLSKIGVPLLAVDTRNTLIQASSFNNTFKTCPSTPLPDNFVGGQSTQVCLVYLVPTGGTLTAMSYRPLQAFEPILWKGAVTPPVIPKKPKKGKR